MATSGKSTLIKLLQEPLKTQLFSENQTHEPIMEDSSGAHLEFFQSLLSKIDTTKPLVIFDRLYLTQAFRANVGLDAYADVEDQLLAYSPTTVFLEVDEDAIAERVSEAAEHRQASWGDYIKTKGKNPDEIADYYIKQQRSQLELLKQSKLPYKVFNTTDHGYKNVAEELIKLAERTNA